MNNLNDISTSYSKPGTNKPIAPGLIEIEEYFKTYMSERAISIPIDPEEFYDYYTAIGWTLNRNPIVDWQACARLWVRRAVKYNRKTKYSKKNLPW